MNNLKFFKANISFEVNDKPIKFVVYHNLPNVKGLSMDDAVENWAVRTNKYTAKSLCEYIKSKDCSVVCMTETQWKRLNQTPNK